jgi:acyl-CoA synthetase (AMP-forming)/AMP-acid ligase II
MNLTTPISDHAAQRPRALALLTPSLRLTYAALDMVVWQVAGYLAGRGICRGDRVGVMITDCAVGVAVVAALARMGAVQYWFAPSEPEEQQRVAVDRFRLAWLVCDSEAPPTVLADIISIPPTLAAYRHLPANPFTVADDAHAPWLAMMSSGTTGQPKALFQTHGQTLDRYHTCRASVPLLSYDRIFSMPPLCFNVTLQRTLWAFICGGALVMPDDYLAPVDMKFLDSSRVSVLFATPIHLHGMVALAKQRKLDSFLLPHVRDLLCSTAAIDEELRQATRRYVAPNLIIAYGASEVGFLSAVGSFGAGDASGSVGYPVPGVEVQLVDKAGIIDVPGRVGLVRARSPSMSEGYLDDPETSRTFFQDGWFYPGDLGAWSEDYQLIFHGRADDMMVMAGINIYPAEIERVLLQHPSVAEAAAFPVPSRERESLPAAAIVVRNPVNLKELLAFCNGRLGIKAPRFILLLDSLPRNPAGKVLTTALLERLQRERGKRKSTGRAGPG